MPQSCRNFFEIAAAGTSAAACGPPFLLFGLRPRRSGVGFRPLRRARRGFAPSIPTILLEKEWPENLVFLRCGDYFAGVRVLLQDFVLRGTPW